MGGKVAMMLTLDPSPWLRKTVVVDMAPTHLTRGSKTTSLFASYIRAMKEVTASKAASKREADAILAKTIPELSIRQFLLTNFKATSHDGK